VVLSAAINRYAYGSLVPEDGRIRIDSIDFGTSYEALHDDELAFDGELDLAKAVIRRLRHAHNRGFRMQLRSSAPPGSGLGSSSTMIVALVGLLREYYGIPMSAYDIADIAVQIERGDLAMEGGLQDHYSAAFGGFNFIEFGERVVVTPLRISPDTLNELEVSLLLCYSGITRRSDGILADQTQRVVRSEPATLQGLRDQKELAGAMKTALLRGQLRDFGHLLGQAWEAKKKLSPKISTSLIDEAYECAMRNGALGGKVTGAGGGGYILFYCDFTNRHRVAEALEQMGFAIADFGFSTEGVSTWRT